MKKRNPVSNFPTPQVLGYRLPAEWELHEATWMAWPYNEMTWGGHLSGAEEAFLRIIETLLPHEDVHLLVPQEKTEQQARQKLGPLAVHHSLHWHHIDSGDVWIRDYGPIFLIRDQGSAVRGQGWVKFTYNALGKPQEYEDLLIGDTVSDMLPLEGMRRFEAGMVLEGGSIDANGEGLLLTTEQCLLNKNRNPSLSKQDIERRLQDFLGVDEILWLKGGIAGDDTDGHVDDVARFVGPDTVVTCVETNPSDENYEVLRENLRRLKFFRVHGAPLNVVELPMPRPFTVEGRRMAASYANFYIANGIVLVPTYAQSTDYQALQILERCFPEREIVGIDCREFIYGYGAIHCSTMQQTRG